jgi:hypothetical protein
MAFRINRTSGAHRVEGIGRLLGKGTRPVIGSSLVRGDACAAGNCLSHGSGDQNNRNGKSQADHFLAFSASSTGVPTRNHYPFERNTKPFSSRTHSGYGALKLRSNFPDTQSRYGQ